MFIRKNIIILSSVGLGYIANNVSISKCNDENINDFKKLYSTHIMNITVLNYEKSLEYMIKNKLNGIEINNIIENKKKQKINEMICSNEQISKIINFIFVNEKDNNLIDIQLMQIYKKYFNELLEEKDFFQIENFIDTYTGNKYKFFGYCKFHYNICLYPNSTHYISGEFGQFIRENFHLIQDDTVINHIIYYYSDCINIDNFFSNPNIKENQILKYVLNIEYEHDNYMKIQNYVGKNKRILTEYIIKYDSPINDYGILDESLLIDKNFLIKKLNHDNIISFFHNLKKFNIDFDDCIHIYNFLCGMIQKDFIDADKNGGTKYDLTTLESILYFVKDGYFYDSSMFDRNKPTSTYNTDEIDDSELTYTKFYTKTIYHDKQIYPDKIYESFLILLILTNNLELYNEYIYHNNKPKNFDDIISKIIILFSQDVKMNDMRTNMKNKFIIDNSTFTKLCESIEIDSLEYIFQDLQTSNEKKIIFKEKLNIINEILLKKKLGII